MSSAMVAPLEAGRDAVKRHAWSEAMEAFAGVDRDAGLSADDLELMGTAAWWAGKPEDATDALERAFAAYSEAGRNLDAARVGFDLGYQAFRRQAGSVGAGWMARLAGILESEPEGWSHAWLPIIDAVGALMESRIGEGIEHADRAIELGRKHGNPGAQYMATSFKG